METAATVAGPTSVTQSEAEQPMPRINFVELAKIQGIQGCLPKKGIKQLGFFLLSIITI